LLEVFSEKNQVYPFFEKRTEQFMSTLPSHLANDIRPKLTVEALHLSA